MLEKRTPIPVDEAVRRVCHFQKQGETEWVALEDSLHRFLAEDITADHHVPAFDRSPYDGFAVRACDTAYASRENPVRFEVIDHIGAGAVSEKTWPVSGRADYDWRANPCRGRCSRHD